jgi:hypothetical protein
VITCYEYHTGSALGMTQYSAHNIGVTLFPAPFVLLYFPGIDNIAHQIQCVTGVVFEKVVETIGLTIFGSKMDITDKD